MVRLGVIYACSMWLTFDLPAGEADKTIKLWRPDENATEETHPLQWAPTLGRNKF